MATFYRKTSYKSTLTPEEREARAEARFQKKFAQDEARRAKSAFNYATAGGHYAPTERQFKATSIMLWDQTVIDDYLVFMSAQIVNLGFLTGTKVHHDHIHRVNEFIRNNPSLDL
jgi:hypothetical protein